MVRSPWWIALIAILVIAAVAIGYAWTCPEAVGAPISADLGAGPVAGRPAAIGTCVGLRSTIVTEGVKLSMQLAVIGVIGGLAKFVLDALAAARLAREARLATLRGFLARLNAVKARVEQAREILRASETLPSYRDQMKELMGARSDVEALATEISASGRLLRSPERVTEALGPPQAALDGLIEEWVVHEPQMAPKETSPEHQGEIVEHLRSRCPALQDLRAAFPDGVYRRKFLERVAGVSELLQRSIVGKP